MLLSPSVRRLLPYINRYRRAFVLGLICVISTTAFQLMGPWVLKYAVDDLNQAVTAAQAAALRRPARRRVAAARPVPLPDAEDHHRRVPRHRVRHPQRPVRAARAAAARLLPGAAHRRPDVARHQRPELRPPDDRPGGHVHVQHRPGVRRRHPADAGDRRPPDADRARCRCRSCRSRCAISAAPFTSGSRRSRPSSPRSAPSSRRRSRACGSSAPTGRRRTRSSGSGRPTRSTSGATAS